MTKYYKTKETAIKYIEKGETFSNLSFKDFRDDRDCILAVLKKGDHFSYLPTKWIGDREMSQEFLINTYFYGDHVYAPASIGENLLGDREFILETLKKCHNDYMNDVNFLAIYQCCGNEIKRDLEISKIVLNKSPQAIHLMGSAKTISIDVKFSFINSLDKLGDITPDFEAVLLGYGIVLNKAIDYEPETYCNQLKQIEMNKAAVPL